MVGGPLLVRPCRTAGVRARLAAVVLGRRGAPGAVRLVPRPHHRLRMLGVAMLSALPLCAVAAQSLLPIEQISQNTQPGWGKVYASVSATGWFVAFFSNADLAPGQPGNADGSWEVFRWSANGQYTQITASSGERPPPLLVGTSAPSISDDGRRIAFSSIGDHVAGRNRDGSRELFLWEEGKGIRQLTDSPAGPELGSHHSWISGDGRRIVFASDMHGGVGGVGPYADAQTDIYLWTEDQGLQRITAIGSPTSRAWMPRLSRDGRHIAFYANADVVSGGNTDGSPEVYLWSEGALTQLTTHVGGRSMGLWSAPAISDHGDVVAFDADADLTPGSPGNRDSSTEVYVWQRDRGLRQVTNLQARYSARSPTLGAGGSVLAFVSTADLTPGAPGNADGGQELYLEDADGARRQLTRGASVGGIALPVLSAGGALVAFLSDRDLAVGNPVLTPQTFVIRLAAPTPPADARLPSPAVCPQLRNRVPAAVIAAALAQPSAIGGWGVPRNPALSPGPANPWRRWLSLRDLGKPFSPGNPVLWKAGCP